MRRGVLHQVRRISPGSWGTADTLVGGGSAGFVPAGPAAMVVADATLEGPDVPAGLIADTR